MASKKVFIACPIGSDASPERDRSDKLLKHVIHPVIKELVGSPPEDFTVRADKMAEPGRITTQILRELVEADVVVADLTGTNPNVMYEVGIRQALLRPFILMAEKGQGLPFDLNDLRTVFYQLDLDHVEKAQAELKGHLSKALTGSLAVLDEALFGGTRGDGQSEGRQVDAKNMLAVLEVCQGILSETRETKELVTAVGRIVVEFQDSKEDLERQRQEAASQQIGMMFMNQFLQNPEAAEKLIPAMQKMSEMVQRQQRGEQEPGKPSRKRK